MAGPSAVQMGVTPSLQRALMANGSSSAVAISLNGEDDKGLYYDSSLIKLRFDTVDVFSANASVCTFGVNIQTNAQFQAGGAGSAGSPNFFLGSSPFPGFFLAATNGGTISFSGNASTVQFSISTNLGLSADKTITGAGTTGAQTINKPAGSVNFAAAATSLVVTNSMVTANSIVMATVATDDDTMLSVTAVPTAGSFTLHANAAATAETRVNWFVIN